MATQPCPCGFFNDRTRKCKSSPIQINVTSPISPGPLLDQIDIRIDVRAVKFRELSSDSSTESSESIRERVVRTRRVQLERFQGENIYCNAQMTPRLIRKYCAVAAESKSLLEHAITSARLIRPRL